MFDDFVLDGIEEGYWLIWLGGDIGLLLVDWLVECFYWLMWCMLIYILWLKGWYLLKLIVVFDDLVIGDVVCG